MAQIFSTRHHFNKNNILNLKENVSLQSQYDVFEKEEADEAYSKFITLVTSVLDIPCPYKIDLSRNKLHRQRTTAYNHIQFYANNREVGEMKRTFTEAQDKFVLTGRLENRADSAQKKKQYDLNLRTLRQKKNYRLISESSNKSKAI